MNESMTCGRCGRLLKDSKSKKRGYVPVCWKKVREQVAEDDSNTVQESLEV